MEYDKAKKKGKGKKSCKRANSKRGIQKFVKEVESPDDFLEKLPISLPLKMKLRQVN